MMKLRMAAIGAFFLSTPAFANQAQSSAQGPKLLVVLSVDQFSSALFSEYRPRFTGGLKRLADGIAFANGYQAHGATETCPGHSTILTGAHPARTGIIANSWYDFTDPRRETGIYCAEDERVSGSSAGNYAVSEAHLRIPTLGDRLKRASPSSRVVAVAGKDRSAVMMGGHATDQRWWWKGSRFVQNSAAAPAPIAAQVNASVAKAIATTRAPLVPPEYCADKDRAIDLGSGKTVGTYRFQRAAGDAAAFSTGPELDAAVLALSAGLIRDMQLGQRDSTDVIAIGLSATDYVGHRYGSGGVEMCLQLMSLDSDLGAFFTLLDRSGIDYAVALTADHGGLDIPERLRGLGVADAARLDPAATMEKIGERVARQLGIATPVFVGDWYIAPKVPQGRRSEVAALATRLLRAHPQVDSVYSVAQIAAHPMPRAKPERWSVLDRLRASYDRQRSPDLAVVYKPHVMPIPNPIAGYVATHGSVWDYDRKVPILFWWPGIKPQDRPESAMTVDIMPTLAGLIGLDISGMEIDGRCLDLRSGPAATCR